ncbi:hypothetical protein BDV25DRAFT_135128 [Aspergillus avenaceus]|uniref:FAD dependent oxidoreductase domain-containing protein n=1 Tax=Aspergillus avenaceus TaxID=36643 RepID=A0A5N6U8Z1_ASPAV|nr:hypothetical protein BDV25DRAFT_135128 [Aspergillus avenaceus]
MAFMQLLLSDPGIPLQRRRDALSRALSDPGIPAPPEHRTNSFWLKDPHPTLANIQFPELPQEADIMIIGTGITGTSVARTLLEESAQAPTVNAERPKILMLETQAICSGATGRNRGHILKTAEEFIELESRHGLQAATGILRFRLAHTVIVPRKKGGRRDLSRERRQLLAQSVERVGVLDDTEGAHCGLLSKSITKPSDGDEQERLFQEFLSSGINVLHPTSVNDSRNLLGPMLPTLCRESKALYAVCVALQASLCAEMYSQFFEHFDTALTLLRNELSHSLPYLEDPTFTAGLFLSGSRHALDNAPIWNAWNTSDAREQPFVRTAAISYPFRGHGSHGSAYLYSGTDTITASHQDPDIEVVSGLPRSLVDIFSMIGSSAASERDFWYWPGSPGNLLQQQLWEPYRLAGMLAIRDGRLLHSHLDHTLAAVEGLQTRQQDIQPGSLPSTTAVVFRIVSNLAALCIALAGSDGPQTLVFNAIKYPAFVVGLEKDIINKDPGLKGTVYQAPKPDMGLIKTSNCYWRYWKNGGQAQDAFTV